MSSTGDGQAHCLRCGRRLTAAASIREKYGRWCRAKMRTAALAEALARFTAEQVEKARQLIEDGGLIAAAAGMFSAVSSRGDATYTVSAAGPCDCKAGQNGRQCYHLAAACIMGAGRSAAAR